MKKKIVIIGAVAVLAVLAVVAGILLSQRFHSKPTYEARIISAQKYFDAGKYDDAILEYQKAIEMDENREEAYVGLADLYYHQGLLNLARKTLDLGLARTNGSDELQTRLAVYFPDNGVWQGGGGDQPGGNGSGNGGELGLNVELLQFISGASYNDYLNRYDQVISSMEGDRCLVKASGLSANIVFFDSGTSRSVNTTTGTPYVESIPNMIQFNDICQLFGGVNQVEYSALQSMSQITELTRSGNTVEFKACGCKFSVTCDENGTIHAGAENSVIPTGTATVTRHVLRGVVIDATTGHPVSGATVRFSTGYSVTAETITDSAGQYEVQVGETGAYVVVITMPGFIEESFSIYVPDASAELSNDFTISPTLAEDEIRIVLTWGAFPSDLDSHLHGTMDDGSGIWVYFGRMSGEDNAGNVVAELDVDDTSSYGPETITIHDTNGVFYFDVADYTESTGVGTSGATVKIYKGDTLVETITPDSSVGYGWAVCKIDHGVITVTNTEQESENGLIRR